MQLLVKHALKAIVFNIDIKILTSYRVVIDITL
jgi:hypothetical protein